MERLTLPGEQKGNEIEWGAGEEERERELGLTCKTRFFSNLNIYCLYMDIFMYI